MKNLISLCGLLCLIFLSTDLLAQDILHKKTGKTLEVKVLEIGSSEVKYIPFNGPETPQYSIDKDELIKIELANGETIFIHDNFSNPEFYADQKKRALKMNFLSPLYGYTGLSFEQNLQPGRSIEINVGLIGLGKTQNGGSYYNPVTGNYIQYNREHRGMYISGGYKFQRTPDYYIKGMRYAHLLKGGYVKPELSLGMYSENKTVDGRAGLERRTITFGALMLNIGKQWVFSDVFLVDLYFGLGYGFDNQDEEYFDADYHFNHILLGEGLNFAMSGGLKIGFLF